MTLKQRVETLEKEVAELKVQIEGPTQQEELRHALRLAELRKMRMQKRLDTITNPAELQVFLDALAKLDCYIQSLPQRYQEQNKCLKCQGLVRKVANFCRHCGKQIKEKPVIIYYNQSV